MTYREQIHAANLELAKDPATIFIGYGISGNGALGTLKGVPSEQVLETPTAENLMAGLALGLSLKGRKPVVFYERADFILNALDAIVNHIDKLEAISKGEFKAGIIFRVIVGNTSKPLFTGVTHTQTYAGPLHHMLHSGWVTPLASEDPRYCDIAKTYREAAARAEQGGSTYIFEWKDKY